MINFRNDYGLPFVFEFVCDYICGIIAEIYRSSVFLTGVRIWDKAKWITSSGFTIMKYKSTNALSTDTEKVIP